MSEAFTLQKNYCVSPTLHLSRCKKYDIESVLSDSSYPRLSKSQGVAHLSRSFLSSTRRRELRLNSACLAIFQHCRSGFLAMAITTSLKTTEDDAAHCKKVLGCETCKLACENISFTCTDVETSTLQNNNLPIQASLNGYPYNLVHDMLRVLNSSTLLVRHHHLRISDRHQHLNFVNQLKKSKPPSCDVCEKKSASQCALVLTVPLVPDGHFRLHTRVQLCVSYQKTNVFN